MTGSRPTVPFIPAGTRPGLPWTGTAVLLSLVVALCACSRQSEPLPRLEPVPGQIIADPAAPAWLKRHGGGHVFVCGPGEPEGFLYRGTRNPDGTRSGDQMELIEKLAEHGGNCIYMQVVRTHGGDAGDDRTQNPFVDSDPSRGLDERILAQWERWFSAMDGHGILMYLFLYDDGACIWETGDRVSHRERAFVEGIVRRFQHHKNLIWMVAEESEERYSTKRVQRIAEIIRQSDRHGHLVGNHHQSGTAFKAWVPGGALDHFGMQLSAAGDDAHAGAVEALREADGRYQVIYAESTTVPDDVESLRRFAWAVAMGGLMPMIYQMDIATTPESSLNQLRYLQGFFESTDVHTMSPHDELGALGTDYVLANPGRSYIAYSSRTNAALGLKELPAGRATLKWMDCRTGLSIRKARTFEEAGPVSLARPPGIGQESVVWIRFDDDTAPRGAREGGSATAANESPAWSADYFPPPESQGGWRRLEEAGDILGIGGMDPDQLDALAHWLKASDDRDFAAVVIRHGYVVLEVERGNSARSDSGRVASVSKAVCATVTAIASERSRTGQTPTQLSIDDPAFQFIPWAQPLSDPRKARITVRQLLNHTSGICPEATGAPNDGSWDYVLGHSGDPRTADLAFPPGEGCGYSTLAFDHAALLCEAVTGLRYDQFAIRHLFEPIGCEHWTFKWFEGEGLGRYPTHRLGMSARDLARIAYCMLQEGRWGRRQVIPRWYVDEIALPRSTHGLREMRWGLDSSHYALGWEVPFWLSEPGAEGRDVIPADARFKTGSGGQYLGYVPSLDLVITRQTGGSGPWDYDAYLQRACRAVVR